jgi:hypothetical protein
VPGGHCPALPHASALVAGLTPPPPRLRPLGWSCPTRHSILSCHLLRCSPALADATSTSSSFLVGCCVLGGFLQHVACRMRVEMLGLAASNLTSATVAITCVRPQRPTQSSSAPHPRQRVQSSPARATEAQLPHAAPATAEFGLLCARAHHGWGISRPGTRPR